MSDATYSRVEMSDLGDGTQASQPPERVAGSASSSRSVDFEKRQNSRYWRESLTRETLLKRAMAAREATSKAVPVLRTATMNAVPVVKTGIRTRAFRLHASAFLVFFSFGLLPLIIYFRILPDPFVAHPVECESVNSNGTGVGIEEESPGIEGLFTIDRVGGGFPFWLAKLLDTIWDLFVARGMQFLAGWISYSVFSNALLRAIEASPIPYRTFTGIALNGASAWTVISMLADLRRYSRKRSMWLFAYGTLALSYVLAMPTLLSAMTGYISASSAYTKVPGSEQFVPTSFLKREWIFYDLPGIKNSSCLPADEVSPIRDLAVDQFYECNSTCVTHTGDEQVIWLATGEVYEVYEAYAVYESDLKDLLYSSNCSYFSNETYTASRNTASSDPPTHNCADPVNLVIDGTNVSTALTMSLGSGRTDIGYCYNGTGYPDAVVDGNSRCLPATDGPALYRWGFSAMLTSVVLVVHACWACSLYAIWLEAQWSSALLRDGYRLTQLRGAFAVGAAAQASTGLGAGELIRVVGAREVEEWLTRRGVAVGVAVFEGEGKGKGKGGGGGVDGVGSGSD